MADPTPTSSARDLERTLNVLRIASNINLACVVAIYYDWITILDTEIELIWKAKWSRLTVSYLLARYLTLAYCPMVLYYQFEYSLSEFSCTKLYNAITLTIVVATVSAAMILIVRTVAIWGGGRGVTYVAYGLYVAATIVAFVFSILSFKYTSHWKPTEIAGSIGCMETFQTFHLAVVFIVDTVADTANLALLLIRGTSLLWWGRDSRLFRTIYGDGILFYVYMTGTSITNLILMYSSNDLQPLLMMAPGALRAFLSCRVLLHIRMQLNRPPMIGMSQDAATAQQSKMSTMEFRPV